MEKKVLFVLAVAATAFAGVIPTQKILQGPSTKTRVIGPDGSVIEAYAPGGKIILEENAGVAVQEIPVAVASAAVPQSLQALEAKNVVLPIQPEPQNVLEEEPVVVVDGKIPVRVITVTENIVPLVAAKKLQAAVTTDEATPVIIKPVILQTKKIEPVEPSSLLESKNLVNEPVVKVITVSADSKEATTESATEPSTEVSSTEAAQPKNTTSKTEEVVAVKVVVPQEKAAEYQRSLLGVPEVVGIEGEYIDDNKEKLYDDGSYRPEHY